jgi:hypothetical protein
LRAHPLKILAIGLTWIQRVFIFGVQGWLFPVSARRAKPVSNGRVEQNDDNNGRNTKRDDDGYFQLGPQISNQGNPKGSFYERITR